MKVSIPRGMRSALVPFLLMTFLLAGCAGGLGKEQKQEPAAKDLTFSVGDIEVQVSEGALEIAEGANASLEELVRGSLRFVVPALGSPSTEIRISDDAERAIPEVGVGGYTHGDGSIDLALDPEFEDPERALNVSLPVLIAHEMHHSKRIQDGPGYGGSLGEAVVTEGLAYAFAAEVFPNNGAQPWVDALTKKQRAVYEEKLKRNLGRRDHSVTHGEWFFGRGNIPRWTGYTLGYEITTGYMAAHHVTAAGLAEMNARTILRWWRKNST